MSDGELFQNTDEQEATYAPQQLPAGDPGARQSTDELGDRDTGIGVGDFMFSNQADSGSTGRNENAEGGSGQTPSG